MSRALAGNAIALSLVGTTPAAAQDQRGSAGLSAGEMLPTGQQITPTAAPGSSFLPLLPIPSSPDFKDGQAVRVGGQSGPIEAVDPDQRFQSLSKARLLSMPAPKASDSARL